MSMVINNHPDNASGSTSSLSAIPPSPSSSSSSSAAFRPAGFLDQCFFCGTKLSPGKDIYMYRGDRAFCSEECRCRQILLDEEEGFGRENHHGHFSVGGRTTTPHPSSSSSSSSSRNKSRSRNKASGGV